MTMILSRRSFIQASFSAAGRPRDCGFRPRVRGRDQSRRRAMEPGDRQGARRGQRLRRDRPRQFHHAAHPQIGDGARPADRARDDSRRGAGMRLRQGEGRVRLRPPQPYRQQCLSVDGDRRVPVGARLAGVPAAGGRLGPRAAHRGGGGEMGRRAGRVRRKRRPGAARGLRALGDFRRTCGRRGEDRACDRAGDQDARSVQAYRHRASSASTRRSRSRARRASASIPACRAWPTPPPPIARCSAASSNPTISPRSPAVVGSSPPCR